MNSSIERLEDVQRAIASAAQTAGRNKDDINLIAVSKTFDAQAIRPVLEAGHRCFGENRVQEAQGKWPGLREEFDGIELHLIGPLQTNKVKDAVQLFDVIETLDRAKLAGKLAKEMEKTGRRPKLYVQINTGMEPQKAGIAPDEADDFIKSCQSDYGLSIEGLMCIPPFGEEASLHFSLLEKIAKRNGIISISMGMSADYETAIAFGATHVRVGSAIFGNRY